MNDKQVVDALIDALVDKQIVSKENIFAGRIYPTDTEAWSVSLIQPAENYGGNNAKYKILYYVSIDAYANNAEVLYDKTAGIYKAIASIMENPQVINASVGGLSDLDVTAGEMRHVQWIAQIITYAPGWMDWAK